MLAEARCGDVEGRRAGLKDGELEGRSGTLALAALAQDLLAPVSGNGLAEDNYMVG